MLEWKIVSMHDKNPQIVPSFDYTNTSCNHPIFQEFIDICLDRNIL